MLILGTGEAADVVTGPDTLGSPIVGPTLATELDASVEPVVLELISRRVVLAPKDTDELIVVPTSQLVVTLILVAVPPLSPPTPTTSLYALSAAPSALLTAASGILYCVPPHADRTACSGAVKNSG